MPRFSPAEHCRPAVLDVQPYSPGKSAHDLGRQVGDVLKLSSNENVLGPSPTVAAAVRECSDELMRYPDGDGWELREALAAHHGVAPENVTLGNGSNELLELAGRCFLDRGTNAVYSEHGFAVYELTAQICGATARAAPARAAADTMPYGHDLAAMAAAMDAETRVVFIANPNNPTGTWLNVAELEGFLECAPTSAVIVVDEAYAEYVTEPGYPATAEWIGRFPNLLVARTFSKAYGLAGLRVGYGLCDASLAELLNRVRQPFNVNLPAQRGALAALKDRAHVEKSVAMNRMGLEQLAAGCRELGLAWLPSIANFLCIEIGNNASVVYEALLERGVIVRPIDNYGLPRHLRVTVGRPEDNRRFLDALEEALQVS